MDPEIAEWLQRVLLTIGYQHRDRMYADVEAVLRLFQNFLVPKAETYTHDNGRSQLLLSLIGTVPIVYQSATYNIPVAFWLPTSYPSVAPIVFVTPTALMLVKAGKYVDISGRCYHPYLAYWSQRSDSNLVDLIGIMQGVFSQEPPVYAKSNAVTQQQQQQQSSPTLSGYPSPTTTLAALLEFNTASSREMDNLVTVNKQLNDAEFRTKAEIQSLRDLHTKIQYNIATLSRCIEQLTAKIEQIRLFELVAEEIAIEDTIYYLGKALSQDKVELNAYMKHLRNLSREQFMKKALIKKVKAQLGHIE
ncbi:hypothetical protein BGZ52_007087 [Haplosporangium bisporale]|nr:hypothetical protein BGZ52_007087 [Haplosporangium bisporale]KAF9216726.1 hypothetical protein BGZ59_008334 [Podila verticillata]